MPSLGAKHRCTTSTQRCITRWEHEHVLGALQKRLDEKRTAKTQRPKPQPLLPAGNVAKFARAKLQGEDGASITFDELYAAYEAWCTAEKARALPRADFDTTFVKLCKHVGFHHEGRGTERLCRDLRLAA